MATRIDRYFGFEIEAMYYPGGNGFMPTVTIRKYRDDSVRELQLTPPGTEGGYDDAEQALEIGIDYAKRVIDGRIPGEDVSKL